MKDELDGAAASSGAVRDGSGLSAVPSSASPNPNRGVAPPSAAEKPSRDGDALPVFVCDVDESADLRDGPPAFLTVPAAARRLGVSTRTAYRLIEDEALPAVELRGLRRIPSRALDAWITEQERRALANARLSTGDPIRIYCRGLLQQATYVGGGRAMCPCCGKKRRVVW